MAVAEQKQARHSPHPGIGTGNAIGFPDQAQPPRCTGQTFLTDLTGAMDRWCRLRLGRQPGDGPHSSQSGNTANLPAELHKLDVLANQEDILGKRGEKSAVVSPASRLAVVIEIQLVGAIVENKQFAFFCRFI